MDIVGGLDVHRKQITFDYVQMETGESHRGEIRPADREHLRSWLERFAERFRDREAAFAVEATTGWRYVVEELERAGIEAHLAESADTRALQGRKSAPRPTASTLATSESCSSSSGFRSHGSHPSTSSRSGR